MPDVSRKQAEEVEIPCSRESRRCRLVTSWESARLHSWARWSTSSFLFSRHCWRASPWIRSPDSSRGENGFSRISFGDPSSRPATRSGSSSGGEHADREPAAVAVPGGATSKLSMWAADVEHNDRRTHCPRAQRSPPPGPYTRQPAPLLEVLRGPIETSEFGGSAPVAMAGLMMALQGIGASPARPMRVGRVFWNSHVQHPPGGLSEAYNTMPRCAERAAAAGVFLGG